MRIVAVDLAAKYSAAMLLDADGTVNAEFDSHLGENLFLTQLSTVYACGEAGQLVVEDLPHGVGYRNLVKRVCQIQGRIAECMLRLGRADELVFVAPATWRNTYHALRKRGLGPEAVVPVAEQLGYRPPNLNDLAGPRGGRALADKIQTDYCAAFLIGKWAHSVFARTGTFDVPGTERYGGKTRTGQKHLNEDVYESTLDN